MCPNFETPKRINFPFGTNRKFIILGVSILMHITVMFFMCLSNKEWYVTEQILVA